jgi:exopolysaccharide biosynthesis polyprenyl glycosylphosphotransferase
MFEQQHLELRRTMMMTDACLTITAYVVACATRFGLGHGSIDLLSHFALILAMIPLWFLLLRFLGAYDSPRMMSRRDYLWAIIRAVAVGLAVIFSGLFLFRVHHLSWGVIVLFALLDVAALFGVRLWMIRYFHRSIERMENVRRVLIVGTGPRATQLAEALLQRSEWGIHIIGHLDPDPDRVGTRVFGSPVIGTVDDITAVLRDHVIDQVLIATPRDLISAVVKVAKACEEEGIKHCLMADLFDVKVARIGLTRFGPIPLLVFEPVFQDELRLLVKRMIDLAAILCMLPLLLPVIGLIAIAIKLDSAGPVLFCQDRVGYLKRRFKVLKFRTMVDGADKLLSQLEHLNEAAGPIFKIKNDPRITRVGRFLRRSSLDELPQIFNVIAGDMSLVGPRPMSLRDVQLFDQGLQRKRFSVKPGLTCLWQVSGRSLLPFSKWLELDLHYIDNWSLALDFRILARTIPVVLKGTGAV